MLNKSILMGRITHTPEIRETQNNKKVMNFSIAVNRGNKDEGTDFFNCVAWEKRAEFIEKYFKKGDAIIVSGKLQTRKYENKEGAAKIITELIVQEVNFCAYAKKEEQQEITDNDLPY